MTVATVGWRDTMCSLRPIDCGFSSPAGLISDDAELKGRRSTISSGRKRKEGYRRLYRIAGALALCLVLAMPINASEAVEPVFDIDIPALSAAEALNRLAEQTGSVMLFPYNLARARQANAVRGRYTLLEGLELLLRDTGLSGGLSDKRVVIIADDEDTPMGKGDSMKKRGLYAGIIAALAAVVGVDAGADQAEGPTGMKDTSMTVLADVIVTSRRREERLQDVPISIATYSADQLRDHAVESLSDISFVPNMTFFQHGQSGAAAGLIYIRGVGQSDTLTTNDPGVGVYLDGVYIARMQGLDFDLLDVERVEVLRGPQGTMFGKNTIGGAISIASVRPSKTFAGMVGVGLGQYDQVNGRVSLDFPLVPGTLGARLTVLSRRSDGYGKRLGYPSGTQIDEMSNQDRQAGRLSLDWTPTDDVDVLVTLDKSRVRNAAAATKVIAFNEAAGLVRRLNRYVDPPFGSTFVTDGDYNNYATGSNAYYADAYGASVVVDWKLGRGSIKSISAYRDTEVTGGVDPDGTPYSVLNSDESYDQNQFSQEFQLSGTAWDGKLDWLGGLYYFTEKAGESNSLKLFDELRDAAAMNLDMLTTRTTDNETFAAFGHGTYRFGQRLSMSGGIRYSNEKKTVERARFRPSTGAVLAPPLEASGTWSDWSPKISVEYRPAVDDTMVYASVAQGFKSGGLNGRSTTSDDFLPYEPERILTYETGLKSEVLGGHLRFNATVFYSDYKDIQVTLIQALPDGTPLTTVGNAAVARVKGLEIETTALLGSRFRVDVGLGWTDAAYTEIGNGVPGTTEDTRFVKTPKWSGALAAAYEFSVGGIGPITARVDYAYKSSIEHDALNSPWLRQSSYGVLNGRLAVEMNENWQVAAYVTNITDEHYLLGGVDRYAGVGLVMANYGPPRQWGVDLRFNFK
ncbi:MAG: TonB-dependent receptor [Gammaproteobacteria bacterium]|nr:MAG: TonB-dependent receptor [Gammaproteobacteria bacterium]